MRQKETHKHLILATTAFIPFSLLREYQSIHAARPDYGPGSGDKVCHAIASACAHLPARFVVDYGCGNSTMILRIWPRAAMHWRYDPAVPQYNTVIPETQKFSWGLCSDMLEHVPENELDDLLRHLWHLSANWVFIVCTRPAGQLLSDGSNAHVTVKPSSWWLDKLRLFWRDTARVQLATPADRPGFITAPQ